MKFDQTKFSDSRLEKYNNIFKAKKAFISDHMHATPFQMGGIVLSLNTPLVFMVFNRPHLTKIVFHAIAKAKAKKLCFIADGHHFEEETEKWKKARSQLKL